MNEQSLNIVLTKYVIDNANKDIIIEDLKQKIEELQKELDEKGGDAHVK